MIARIWRGWAPRERAGAYQRHYETEVSAHLRAVSGFRGAQLLRRDEGGEVAFTSITWFTRAGIEGRARLLYRARSCCADPRRDIS